jgi:hypothetical protein
VKVGEILIVPDFTVTDNVSTQEEMIVAKYVCNPYGSIIKLLDGNSMKVEHVGTYEICVIAIDKIGNMKMIQVYVTVTE